MGFFIIPFCPTMYVYIDLLLLLLLFISPSPLYPPPAHQGSPVSEHGSPVPCSNTRTIRTRTT